MAGVGPEQARIQPAAHRSGELSNLTFEKVRALLLSSVPLGLASLVLLATLMFRMKISSQLKRLSLRLNAVFASNDPTKLDNATLNAVLMLFHDWSINRGSLQILAKQLADAAAAVLSGDLKRIVDLEGAKAPHRREDQGAGAGEDRAQL